MSQQFGQRPSFSIGEHKDVALENHNLPFVSYKSSSSITGPTLEMDKHSPRPFNRIRIYLDVTTGGSTGTGTSPINALIQSLHIYKGTQKAHSTEPVVEIKGASLIYAALVSAIRGHPGVSYNAVGQSFINEVAAGNAQYKLMCDLVMNLPAGDYYIALVMNAVSVLAGYSGAVTTMSSNFGVDFISEGQVVPPEAMDSKLKVETVTTTTGFNRTGVYEAFLMCATEMSTISTVTWANFALTANGVKANEVTAALRAANGITAIAAATLPYPYSVTNPNLAAGTAFYIMWLTNESPTELKVDNSSATTMYLATYR